MDWNFGFSQQAPGDYGPGEAPQQTGLLSYLGDMLSDPRKANALASFGEALSRAGAPSTTRNNWGGALGQAFAGMRQGNQQYDQDRVRSQMQQLQLKSLEQTVNQKVDPLSYLGKIDVEKFTPDSIAHFMATKNPALLVARNKKEFAPNGVAVDPYNLPEGQNFSAPRQVDSGSAISFLDPNFKPLATIQKGVSPDTKFSGNVTMRGQDLTNARATEGLDLQRVAGRNQYENTPSGPMLIDKATGEARNVTLNGTPLPGDAQQKKQQNAGGVIALLDQAEKLLPNATNSVVGAGVDLGAKVFGAAPKGAQAIGQLKTIEGALLMQMPRMEGPQSNYDVQNYKEAAGKLGDPMTPNPVKRAAIKAIREIQTRYQQGPQGAQPTNTASGNVRVVDW